jgi:hypothetical protein
MKAFHASFGIEFEFVLFDLDFLGKKVVGFFFGLPGYGEKGFSHGYIRTNGKIGGEERTGEQWMNELRGLLRYGFANADSQAVFPVSAEGRRTRKRMPYHCFCLGSLEEGAS